MGLNMSPQDIKPAMDEYIESLPAMQLEPLWTRMDAMVPQSPNPVCQPYLWRYSDCLPFLSKAGALVSEQEAERRVLMLVNPAMSMMLPLSWDTPDHSTDSRLQRLHTLPIPFMAVFSL